jgi:hypothetical protein
MILDEMINVYVWWCLNWYFSFYRIPTQADDFEKFLGTVSLNGIKAGNICRP